MRAGRKKKKKTALSLLPLNRFVMGLTCYCHATCSFHLMGGSLSCVSFLSLNPVVNKMDWRSPKREKCQKWTNSIWFKNMLQSRAWERKIRLFGSLYIDFTWGYSSNIYIYVYLRNHTENPHWNSFHLFGHC